MPVSLASNAITDLDKVKEYLNLGTLAIEHNDWLTYQINSMSSMLESRYDRKIAVQDIASEIRNGNGRSKMRTIHYPVTQLSIATTPSSADILGAVQFRDDVDSAWEDIETNANNILINSPADFYLSQQTSHNIELLEESFPEGIANIQFKYKTGFASPAIEEVEMIVIEMVAMRYKESNRKGSQLGLSSTNDSIAGRSGNIVFKDLKLEWQKSLDRILKRRI
jgi:hypothetical protein